MRRALVWAALVSGVVVTAVRADDYDKIEGTWRLTRAEAGGKKVAAVKLGKQDIVIKGGKMQTPDQDDAVSFKLDPSQDPKAIDIYEGRNTIPGIYALDGDELKLCYERGAKMRPTKFATQSGSRLIVYVFKRQEKPKK